MDIIYKSYCQTVVAALTDGTFRRVSNTVYKIYLILLFSAIMATVGAVLNLVFPLGISNTGLNFILTIWWLYTMNRQKQFPMFLTLLASSLFFGATTSSLISSFFSIEERTIIIFFGGLVLMFCFHLFALRTHTIRVIYEINYFALPLFILSLIISIFFVSHGVFPHDLLYVIPFVIAVPIIWHLGLWFFKDKIWTWRIWIPFHFHLLTVLSYFSHYHVLYLIGIYLFMLCVLGNLKLHTFDSIYLAAHSDEHALFPVSLSFTFFIEFIGRFSYMFISSGRTLYHHMGLRQKWQACCTVCAQVWDFCQRGLRISLDYIMNIFKNVWDFTCAYSGQFRDYLVGITSASIGLAFFSILIFLFFAGRL